MTAPEPAPEGYDWVTCNADRYGSAGNRVHLITHAQRRKEHWQTTVCGSTANVRGIWRRPVWNHSKPTCTECLATISTRKGPRP